MATFGAVNVLASAATQIVPASPYGGEATLQNLGPNPIWVGNDATVTVGGATGGIRILPGGSATVPGAGGGIWGIASTTDQAADLNTRWNVAARSGVGGA